MVVVLAINILVIHKDSQYYGIQKKTFSFAAMWKDVLAVLIKYKEPSEEYFPQKILSAPQCENGYFRIIHYSRKNQPILNKQANKLLTVLLVSSCLLRVYWQRWKHLFWPKKWAAKTSTQESSKTPTSE